MIFVLIKKTPGVESRFSVTCREYTNITYPETVIRLYAQSSLNNTINDVPANRLRPTFIVSPMRFSPLWKHKTFVSFMGL